METATTKIITPDRLLGDQAALPEPPTVQENDASPDVVAALGDCAVLVSDGLSQGLAPLVGMVEQARSLVTRLEGENARLVAALRAVLATAPIRDGVTWNEDQEAVEAAQALLASLEP